MFPRDLFPLPSGADAGVHAIDAWTRFHIEGLRKIDTPLNCAPSLHVSSCFLASYLFLNEQRKKFPFFFTWAILIAFSTLTTKQHYVFDIISGIGLSAVSYLIFYRWVRYAPRVTFIEK